MVCIQLIGSCWFVRKHNRFVSAVVLIILLITDFKLFRCLKFIFDVLTLTACGSLSSSQDQKSLGQKSNLTVEYKPTPIHLLKTKTAACESEYDPEYDPVKSHYPVSTPACKRSNETCMEGVIAKRVKVQELSANSKISLNDEDSGDGHYMKLTDISSSDSNVVSHACSLLLETAQVLPSQSNAVVTDWPVSKNQIEFSTTANLVKQEIVVSKSKTNNASTADVDCRTQEDRGSRKEMSKKNSSSKLPSEARISKLEQSAVYEHSGCPVKMNDLKDDNSDKLRVLSTKLHPGVCSVTKKFGPGEKMDSSVSCKDSVNDSYVDRRRESSERRGSSDVCHVLDGKFGSINSAKCSVGIDCSDSIGKLLDIRAVHCSSKQVSSHIKGSVGSQILNKGCTEHSPSHGKISSHHSKGASSGRTQSGSDNEQKDSSNKHLIDHCESTSSTRKQSCERSRYSSSSDKPSLGLDKQLSKLSKSLLMDENQPSSSNSKHSNSHSQRSSMSQKICGGHGEQSRHSDKSSGGHSKPLSDGKAVSSSHGDSDSKRSSTHKHSKHLSDCRYLSDSKKYSQDDSKNVIRHRDHTADNKKRTDGHNKQSKHGHEGNKQAISECERPTGHSGSHFPTRDSVKSLDSRHKHSDKSSPLPANEKSGSAYSTAECKINTMPHKDSQAVVKNVIRSVRTVDLFGEDSDTECDVKSEGHVRGSDEMKAKCKQPASPASSDDVNLLSEDYSSDNHDSAVEIFEQCQQIYNDFSRQQRHTSVFSQVIFILL